LLFGVENLLVIWLGATMVMDGQFSVGILMAFNAYKSQFDSRVGSLIDKFFELRMLQLQGERLADIVLQAPEVSHGDILPKNLREREASIEIQGLRYRYAEQEPWVLDGLDLRIAGGESVAIVGPSGCGKSTLLGVQWQANVFSHLLRLPAQYFEKRHLGDVVSRFGAVNSIQQTLTAAFLSAVLDGLM
ncbi:ABC transporter transmembrane domain-containing protein, partial [Pseudomonas aeruginosa]|uniref:ABC transporter transmembrane domain-containing protein n=1 Tax=Pseudomonas aeruginosa TaxID=287 RepID=UPI000A805F7B